MSEYRKEARDGRVVEIVTGGCCQVDHPEAALSRPAIAPEVQRLGLVPHVSQEGEIEYVDNPF